MGKHKGYSISKHEGSWQVRVRDPHLRVYRTKSFRDRADAEAWAVDTRIRFEIRMDQGRSPRLSVLGEQYLLKMEANGRSKSHMSHVRNVIDKAVAAGVEYLLDDAVVERAALWLSKLQVQRFTLPPHPASARTKNHYLISLRAIANYGVRKGILMRNPFLAIDLQRELRVLKPLYTIKELRHLVDPAHADHPWWLFGVIVAYTGMRSGEARAMAWNWIDWEKNRIRLPAIFTKTGTDRRIPLQPELAEILRPRAQLGGQAVFPPAIAQADSNDANKEFQNYLHSIGIMPKRPGDSRARSIHCLRHCAACLLTATGLSPFLVMDYLGHTHIATSKHYSTGAQEYVDDVRGWEQGIFNLQIMKEHRQML